MDLGWLTHINENLEVHVGLRSLMNQAILGEGRCTVFELQDTSSRMLKRSVTEVQVHLSVAREVQSMGSRVGSAVAINQVCEIRVPVVI